MPPARREQLHGRSALQGGTQQEFDGSEAAASRRLVVPDDQDDEVDEIEENDDVLTPIRPAATPGTRTKLRAVKRRNDAKVALGSMAGKQQAKLQEMLTAQQHVQSLKAWLGVLTTKDSAAMRIQHVWKVFQYRIETKYNTQLEDAVGKWSMSGMFEACCRRRFWNCVQRFDTAKVVVKRAAQSESFKEGSSEGGPEERWAALRSEEFATMDRALSLTDWVNFARDHTLLHQTCGLSLVVSEFRLRASDQKLESVIGGIRLAFAVLRRAYGEAYPTELIPPDPVPTPDGQENEEGLPGADDENEDDAELPEESSAHNGGSSDSSDDEDGGDDGVSGGGGGGGGGGDDDDGDDETTYDTRSDARPGANFKMPRFELLNVLKALGAPPSLSEEVLVRLGYRKMMRERSVIRLLRINDDAGEFVWESPPHTRSDKFKGLDFDGFESCVEKMIDMRSNHPLLRAISKDHGRGASQGIVNAVNPPDNFSPTKVSHKQFQQPPSPRTWRYQSMMMKRDAIAIVEGEPKPGEGGSVREEHMSAFIYEIVSPLSEAITNNGQSGSDTVVGYALSLPGVVELLLRHQDELQLCYEEYASRNNGGGIRYEDILEFSMRVGLAPSIPNDLSSNYLLQRAFLACKSGNQLGVDLHYDDFDHETLVCPSMGRFRLKSRSRWEIRYRAKFYPPPPKVKPKFALGSLLLAALRGTRPEERTEEVEDKGPPKDPDADMISAHEIETVLSSVGFQPLPGELQSLRMAFGDPRLPVPGEMSARQFHRAIFEVRATSILLRDIRLTFPEFSVCIVLLSHVAARVKVSGGHGWVDDAVTPGFRLGGSGSAFDNATLSCGSAERTCVEILRTFESIRVAFQSLETLSDLPKVPGSLDDQMYALLRTLFEQRRERGGATPVEKVTTLVAQMACFPRLAARGCGLYFLGQLQLKSNFELADADEFVRLMDRVIAEEMMLTELHPSAEAMKWLKFRLVQRLKGMVSTGGAVNPDSLILTATADRKRMNTARKMVAFTMEKDLDGESEPRFSDEQAFIGIVDFWSGCHVCVQSSYSHGLDQVPIRETMDEIMRTTENNRPRKLHSVPGIIDVAYEDDEEALLPSGIVHPGQMQPLEGGGGGEVKPSRGVGGPDDLSGVGDDAFTRPPTENLDVDDDTTVRSETSHIVEAEYSALGSPRRSPRKRPPRRQNKAARPAARPAALKKAGEVRSTSLLLDASRVAQSVPRASQVEGRSPMELFTAGEKCLHAGRDDQAISIITELLNSADADVLHKIGLERRIDVLSKVLIKQAVKPSHLVARPLSQAMREYARSLKPEQVETAHETLLRQQRLTEQHELKVEKAYGASHLGQVVCALRLGCDIAKQPRFALLVPTMKGAERTLALGTGLIDNADLTLWLAARAMHVGGIGSSATSIDDATTVVRSPSAASIASGSVASVQSRSVRTVDQHVSESAFRDRTCMEAIAYFDDMLAIARKRKNEEMQHDAHRLLSQCYLIKGDRRQALTHAVIGKDMSRDDALQQARSLLQLGRVHLEFDELEAASETWVVMLQHCEDTLAKLSRSPSQPATPKKQSSARSRRPPPAQPSERVIKKLKDDLSRCAAAAHCFYSRTLFFLGDMDAALGESQLHLEAAEGCNDRVGAIVARLNVGFVRRSIGGPAQLKAAAALYEHYLMLSTAEETGRLLVSSCYGNPAQIMAAMQTHAHYCLSEVHTSLSHDREALNHRKQVGSLDHMHGDINTLGEIYAKRALGELLAADVRAGSLLDDSDDEEG